MLCLAVLQDEKRSLDHNSVYSKDRSINRDRVGRADDPNAGVSNNNLKDIVSPLPNQQQEDHHSTLPPPPPHLSRPSTVLLPPQITLSGEEDTTPAIKIETQPQVPPEGESEANNKGNVSKGIFSCGLCSIIIYKAL